ncbi:ABC transporter ATP-binding protein [Niameybacter massiliensis]|uniref:ABC transporter ATP-binding protein n=1 Tax=Niameybacter massiliensis TaxID=1658108 RepID=UPI0006B614DF|nr:ABC transporter ATP-binding protein [Niameybacter massiliensis]
MSNQNVKLKISNMKKVYKNGDGVDNINIDVFEGEFLTMLGPSGCGKSTILRTLGGFLDIDGGDIEIDGQSVKDLPPEQRPTAMVFQSYNLWPHMTVFDNLAFGLKIRKVPKDVIKEEITKALKLVCMEGFDRKYPGQLSGGQQQRVAIARALLLKPSVLLLDEPFSALDAKIRSQMREELKKIQEDLNITVVFVTHDQTEAMALSHRIVVMNKGKVEQIGTPTEIYDTPATKYVASFIGEMNFFENGDGTTTAVRPEDIVVEKDGEGGDIEGHIRTIMILGHYVEVNIQVGDNVVKTYLSRSVADILKIKDKVSLSFHKKCVYSA